MGPAARVEAREKYCRIHYRMANCPYDQSYAIMGNGGYGNRRGKHRPCSEKSYGDCGVYAIAVLWSTYRKNKDSEKSGA